MTRKKDTPVYKPDQRPDLGRGLQRLREQRGLTLQAMADSIGVPLPTYYGWETGTRFPRDLEGLLIDLGVSVTQLFDVPR